MAISFPTHKLSCLLTACSCHLTLSQWTLRAALELVASHHVYPSGIGLRFLPERVIEYKYLEHSDLDKHCDQYHSHTDLSLC